MSVDDVDELERDRLRINRHAGEPVLPPLTDPRLTWRCWGAGFVDFLLDGDEWTLGARGSAMEFAICRNLGGLLRWHYSSGRILAVFGFVDGRWVNLTREETMT